VDLTGSIDRIAHDTGFSGVVRVDRDGEVELAKAYGDAHRALGVPNTVETQFAVASGNKTMTALAVISLIEDGVLDLATTARSILGPDLPLIADDVTVEALLAHRSGIGDYLDEEDETVGLTDYVLPVPVHQLATTEQFLAVLDGHPTKFPVGERFSYCNGGFMVLALLAERASGTPFHDLVAERVCRPAGMGSSAFLRSDELPGRAAIGYLDTEGLRSNIFHLPVRGNGDGGMYTTVGDVHAFWDAFLGGRIVGPEWVAGMIRPRSDVPEEGMRYGLGVWLHATTDAVILLGADAGASFRTLHDPATRVTYSVLSNTTSGAWPMVRALDERLST
jgi:CubicO group peptidase (beta-lactamase class C family)